MRDDVFCIRLSSDERNAIDRLARRLQRSRADAVRWIIVNADKFFDMDLETADDAGLSKEIEL